MVVPKYKRILIKLSGEALAGEKGIGINISTVQKMAEEIKEVHDLVLKLPLLSVVGISGVESLRQKQEWIVYRLTILECLGPL